MKYKWLISLVVSTATIMTSLPVVAERVKIEISEVEISEIDVAPVYVETNSIQREGRYVRFMNEVIERNDSGNIVYRFQSFWLVNCSNISQSRLLKVIVHRGSTTSSKNDSGWLPDKPSNYVQMHPDSIGYASNEFVCNY